MRAKLKFAAFLAAWLWMVPLYGQEQTITVSGEKAPQVWIGNITLHPPDYVLDINCEGGPWKLKITGDPSLQPAPKWLPDDWFACSAPLRVHFAYSRQPAQLIVIPATPDAPTRERHLLLEFAPTIEPASPGKTWAVSSLPLLILAAGLLIALFALLFALQIRRALLNLKEQSKVREDEWRRRFTYLEQRLDRTRTTLELLPAYSAAAPQDPGISPSQAQAVPEKQRAMAAVASMFSVSTDVSPEANGLLLEKCEGLLRDLERWCSRVKKRGTELPDAITPVTEELRKLAAELSESVVAAAEVHERWSDLAFSAVSLVVEHTDQHIDQRRDNEEWQALLRRILETAEVQLIQPRRNDKFVEEEHIAVSSAPNESPDDQTNHVAQLRHRGFRMGSKVLRKASVVVYQ